MKNQENKREVVITYLEPPEDLKEGNFLKLLKYFGPGAILTSITIGSGEVFFSSRGGAVFGYSILWCFILGAIMKCIQTYAANRYITLTGEHPMTRWAYMFPGPKGWFPLLLGVISIMCFPFWEGGVSGLLANMLYNNTKILSQAIWATILIWGAFALFMAGGYDTMEKAQTAIVGTMVVCILAAVVASKPDWLQVIIGSLIPRIPSYEPWIAEKYPSIAARPIWVEIITYMGAIGGGTYDYIGYTGMLREKGWGTLGREDLDEIREYLVSLKNERIPLSEDPAEVKKGLAWAKAAFMDNIVSYGLLVIFTIGFMVNGAVILHPAHLVPADNEMLTHQAKFLTVIHPMLVYLYYVAVFFALFGTVYGIYMGYVYTTYETLSPVIRKIREIGPSGLKLPVALYVAIGGTIAVWTKLNPTVIITPASIIGGVLTGGIWCLAMYWTDKKMLPKPYQLSPIGSVLLIVSGVVMTFMGLVAVLQFFKVI
ncbi:Natural resistance-associated macrophage protein [Caldanaerovirga acetigignens]|uniref:Natural resistance-associated macrophage protein n=1 Tax=Caldanaerovirga acetigignens TaxID=447595 RepID=A0A1M7H9H7_9FIRM|nr:Nramp family divalent metal transporter [Caldanaerovirga acetigignens]SHM25164.1 Natural resistance-associated macrophage protein [Caldanaerovirga acetigignens]